MDIFGHWTGPNSSFPQHSPAISAVSPEFISQVAALYSLLSPQDIAFEACLDSQLTALEAQTPICPKAVFLAKRALLRVAKQALWTQIDPKLAQIAYKVEEIETELWAEMTQRLQGEDLDREKEGERSLSGEIQSFGLEFAQSAAHLSAKVAAETQLLQRYQSLLTSTQELEGRNKAVQPSFGRPKASSDADISAFAGKPSIYNHFQRRSGPYSSDLRPMTLRQLLTLLSEVYAFKDNRELGRQGEPLKEHLERYLDVKYGLKVAGK